MPRPPQATDLRWGASIPGNPTQISTGCLPAPPAVQSIDKADLHKLTWSTTTNAGVGPGVTGRLQNDEDRWENFSDIHGMGKKDTKYMKFQKSRAPLLDYSGVTHKRDFVTFPLGDSEMNTEMARTFRGNVDSGRGKNPARFNDATTYGETFQRLPVERMKEAKLPSTQPKGARTKTLSSVNNLMETRPRSHIEHAPPANAGEEVVLHKPKPNLGLSASWGLLPKSSYRHEHCGGWLQRPDA